MPSLNCCTRAGNVLRGALLSLLVAAAAFTGTWLATPSAEDRLPPLLLDAAASVTSDNFSVATGMLAEETEGYFVLDHATGLLQCYTLYPRNGTFGGVFSANVRERLTGGAGGKGTQFLMVVGEARFPQSSTQPFGSAAVYVLDANSGEFVVYAVPYNRTMVSANRPQQGVLVPIQQGQARQLIDRDALR